MQQEEETHWKQFRGHRLQQHIRQQRVQVRHRQRPVHLRMCHYHATGSGIEPGGNTMPARTGGTSGAYQGLSLFIIHSKLFSLYIYISIL